jgi:hypothetical protein
MDSTSLSRGTLCSVTGSRHASVPASKASTAFLAPLTRATPSRRAPPSTSRYPPPPAPKLTSSVRPPLVSSFPTIGADDDDDAEEEDATAS